MPSTVLGSWLFRAFGKHRLSRNIIISSVGNSFLAQPASTAVCHHCGHFASEGITNFFLAGNVTSEAMGGSTITELCVSGASCVLISFGVVMAKTVAVSKFETAIKTTKGTLNIHHPLVG